MNNCLKTSLTAIALALASSGVLAVPATLKVTDLPTLKANPEHSLASQRVTTRFQRSHYKQFSLNDDFSKQVFQRYLDGLDYNRTTFTQADIDSLKKYETIIDDELKSGKTTAAYAMYNLSMTRRYEHYSYALSLLDQEIKFDTDESMIIDRSEMDWPKTTEELNEYWRQRVKYDALNIKLSDGEEWPKIKELLTKRYNNAIKRLGQSHSEDVFQLYMNSFAREIDPHTSYLSPRSAEDFQEQMNLSLEGIGAVLQADDDYTVIRELVKGGPASESNQLNEDDKIIGVGQDGEEIVDIIGMRLDDVVQLIKGPKGTKVHLQVLPDGKGAKSHVVTIVRDKIRLEDRAAKLEIKKVSDKTIGVIEIPGFYAGLTDDTIKLLDEMNKKGVDGVVIDLRNNGGGALSEAIGLSGLFISKGPVVQVRDGYDRVNVDRDNDGIQYYEGPMTVLINRYSASASEIFAAAMQDYNRAIIIGENTYGKGTVQQHTGLSRIYDLSDANLGFVQYTIQKFYRINGGSTQLKGVVPDIEFPSEILPEDTGESVQDNALIWDQIPNANYSLVKSQSQMSQLINRLKRIHQSRIAKDREFNFIKEDIVKYKQEESENTVSLNEKVREAEINELDERYLSRVNLRQKVEGKPEFKSVDDIPKDYESPDAFLDEAVAIVADIASI